MAHDNSGGVFQKLISGKAIAVFGLACLAAVLYGELRASETADTARYVPLYWLLSAYDNDQERARELYEGKRVVTRGIVAEVEDEAGQGHLLLTTEPAPPLDLRGFVTAEAQTTLASLSAGSHVKVECTIDAPGEHLFAHDCAIRQAD